MKKFLEEFKAFALKGNMIDLAVGMIIGSAFTSIVNSLVNDIFMPVLSIFTGKTLAAANEVTATINYGSFITQAINFLLMAFVVFMVIKAINKLEKIGKASEAPKAPTEKECPYCKSMIPIKAVRCPHCTSELEK